MREQWFGWVYDFIGMLVPWGRSTLINQLGQVVISEAVNGQSHELNISKLAKGIYHVAVGGVVTKLVVE